METTIVYWGYIGIMEKKIETTKVFFPGETSALIISLLCLVRYSQGFQRLLCGDLLCRGTFRVPKATDPKSSLTYCFLVGNMGIHYIGII